MRFSKLFITFLFAVLIATPYAIKRFSFEGETEPNRTAALKRYGFYFQESSKTSGVDFVHSAPTLDSKLDNIMPQVASMGAGVSIVDFDRDGWNDIYLTNSGEGSLNALFRNNGDGSFSDVASETGVADVNRSGTGVSMGAVWGDSDNDGYEDLLIYKWGKTELYRNLGGKSFSRVNVTEFPVWANINTGIWFDYDRDGLLDIFLGGYFRPDIDLWSLRGTRIMPESFEYANNGGRNYILRNLGDGKFSDVTVQLGLESTRWTLAAVAADLTGNGYPDLFVANDYGVSELYLNQEGKRFVDASEVSGIGFSPKSGMNASTGDIFNDGRLSIYESNITENGILLQGNNLWVQTEGSSGNTIKFTNLANSLGVENGGWSWAAQFADLNNDGNLDIFLTNGYVSADRNSSYWYDFSKVTIGNDTIIGDASNWPAMKGRSLAGYQKKPVWINDGNGRFQDAAPTVGITETYDGRAVAVADLWNRGALDVVVANQRGPALVYKNTLAPGNNWIAFDLGPSIGARLTVHWDGRRQVQEVHGGSGYCSQNQRRLHFGLGRSRAVEKVEIRWPSGKTRTINNPVVNKVHRLSG